MIASPPDPIIGRPTGVWGAVLLPIYSSGEIEWAALEDEVDILCHTTLHGIYTNGTAAEFHNQSEAEFDRISQIVAEKAKNSGKSFQLGISNTNPRVARARLSRVVALTPDAVQFTLPDWWPPTFSEIERFVCGLAEVAKDVPLILYNPPHAKASASLEQIASLRALAPNLVGAKLAGGNEEWYADLRRLLRDFSVFVPGHKLAFGRALGASGSYSNVACLSPNGAALHWRLMESDPEAANDLESRINRLLEGHVLPLAKAHGLSDCALDKLLAAAGGWGPVGARLLWPYSYADAEAVPAIARAARQILPELFK